jgi:hypothetical protein
MIVKRIKFPTKNLTGESVVWYNEIKLERLFYSISSGVEVTIHLTFPEVPKQVRDEVRQQFCCHFHAINVSNFREGEQLRVEVGQPILPYG